MRARLLIQLAAVLVAAVAFDAAAKPGAPRPSASAKASAAKPAPAPPTDREVWAEQVIEAVGERTLCTCDEGDWKGHVGILGTSMHVPTDRGITARCRVPRYHNDGSLTGGAACSSFTVIGKLKKPKKKK